MSGNNPVNTILQGDTLSVLRTLPDNYIQTCVTSPPYYGLRSYLPDGHPDKHLEIGLEETPAEYIEKLVQVFREVRRVLRPDGICWINLGDSFAGSWGNYAPRGIKGMQREQTEEGKRWERRAYSDTQFLPPTAKVPGFKPKSLMMIPSRVAIALCTDGWILRQDCIWNKLNAMPESVTDRPTTAHEHIFLLTKNERYFYDAQAIAEPAVRPGDIQTFGGTKGRNYTPSESDPNYRYGKEQWGRTIECGSVRNKRSVWMVASQGYPDAHFATMPPKLVEPCILAGTSPRTCEHCGTPWQRIIVPTGHINKRETAHAPHSNPTKTDSTGWAHTKRVTDQWQPNCKCPNNTGGGKGIVLDPFIGSGTVAMVALQHNRNYLGIELNPDYIDLAKKRIAIIQPNLWSVESDGVA